MKNFFKESWLFWLVLSAFLLGFAQGFFAGEYETLKKRNIEDIQRLERKTGNAPEITWEELAKNPNVMIGKDGSSITIRNVKFVRGQP